MDDTRIQHIATDLGVIEAALPDVLARAESCFGSGEPTEAELMSWAEGLRTEAPHLFGTKRTAAQPATHGQIPDWLPPAERLAQARQMGLAPAHDKTARRPRPFTPSPAQQQQLDAIVSPAERITKYRLMRAEAQP